MFTAWAERVISLFPKEITVHSGIVWRDKIYGDRRQICERVEVYTIKYQLFTFRRPKMKYLLFSFYIKHLIQIYFLSLQHRIRATRPRTIGKG